ncbi:unnamed protein product [Phytophthora fragariaefolia]|uniref:Unnamed protein product n=1 Tax=Phytophthora fragariaefolia TaxID=1490495 RepID=A0A9W6XGP2_9STRA|nr:unnamed protein product [Phytophthora fragariaefolia]
MLLCDLCGYGVKIADEALMADMCIQDKWKNLQRPRLTSRRRRRSPGNLTPPPAQNDEREIEHVAPERPAKRQAPSSENAVDESSVDSAEQEPPRQAGLVAGLSLASVAQHHVKIESVLSPEDEEYHVEDSNSDPGEDVASGNASPDLNELTGSVELKIATDKSFPEVSSSIIFHYIVI